MRSFLLPLVLLLSLPPFLLSAPAMQWGDDGGRIFGSVTCQPHSPPYGSIVSGPGNCHDPSIGGSAAAYKSCVRVWVNPDGSPDLDGLKTDQDFRCTCNPVFPQKGEECDDLNQEAFYASTVLFAISSVSQALTAVFGCWLSFRLHLVNSRRFNAAVATSLFATISSLSESYRNPVFLLRSLPASNPLSIDQPHFDTMISLALPISIVAMVQCLLGLGLSWLDIAEKSQNLRSKNAPPNPRLIASRLFLRSVMFLVVISVIVLSALDLTVSMAYLGIALTVVLLPVLVVGGQRLRALLIRSADVSSSSSARQLEAKNRMGKKDLGGGIRLLVLRAVAVFSTFVASCIWMVRNTAVTYETLRNDWNGVASAVAMFGISQCLWGGSAIILAFFFITNKDKILRVSGREGSERSNKHMITADFENPIGNFERRDKSNIESSL